MAGQAQVTSVAALETFRSDLIVFLAQMRPAMDEVAGELARMKFWLENEQRQVWENQLRLRRRQLEEARAELFNTRMSSLQESSGLQQLAVSKAQRAVAEAEQKLSTLKKWNRELDNLASPLLKPVDQLQSFLAADMARAVAWLTQVIKTLEDYTTILPPNPTTP